eukprot:4868663-Amphidinium_carterae.1
MSGSLSSESEFAKEAVMCSLLLRNVFHLSVPTPMCAGLEHELDPDDDEHFQRSRRRTPLPRRARKQLSERVALSKQRVHPSLPSTLAESTPLEDDEAWLSEEPCPDTSSKAARGSPSRTLGLVARGLAKQLEAQILMKCPGLFCWVVIKLLRLALDQFRKEWDFCVDTAKHLQEVEVDEARYVASRSKKRLHRKLGGTVVVDRVAPGPPCPRSTKKILTKYSWPRCGNTLNSTSKLPADEL